MQFNLKLSRESYLSTQQADLISDQYYGVCADSQC